MIKVSVIMSTYNQEVNVERCLWCWINQANISPSEYEIVVIDDGSKDKTLEVILGIAGNNPQINWQVWQYQGPKKWKIPVHILNTGFQVAKGKVLIMAFDDRLVLPGTIAGLYSPHLENDKLVTGCHGYPLYKDPEKKIGFTNEVAQEEFLRSFYTTGWKDHIEQLGDWCSEMSAMEKAQGENISELGIVAIKKEDWVAIRGWDEQFYAYGYWNLDILQRMKKSGLKVVLVDGLKWIHLWHISHQGGKFGEPDYHGSYNTGKERGEEMLRIQKKRKDPTAANEGKGTKWGLNEHDKKIFEWEVV